MPIVVSGSKFHETWDSLLKSLLESGNIIQPRGLTIREHTNVTVHVEDMRYNVLVNTGRDLNYRFMAAEWLWIAMGYEDLRTIAQYNREMEKFSDDGEKLFGAYGPRLMPQWRLLVNRLQNDPSTRQAVAVVFRGTDLQHETRDLPCTISIQLLARNDRLNATVTMRSSDIWLGLPYDFFTFSMIAMHVANELAMVPGSMTFNIGSSHLYDIHLKQALQAATQWRSYTLRSPALPWPPGEMWFYLQDKNRTVGTALGHREVRGTIWERYVELMRRPTRHDALAYIKEAICHDLP